MQGKTSFRAEVVMRTTARTSIIRILAVAVFWVFLSAGQYACADLYSLTITATPPPDDVSTGYNGRWVFDVSLNSTMDRVVLRVVSGNNASNTATYRGVYYSYNAAIESGTDYAFGGTSLSTPARGRYNLGVFGFFDPVNHTLSFTNPVTSQYVKADGTLQGEVYNFTFSDIRRLPEPSSSVIALVSLGIVGTGLTLKRRLKTEGEKRPK
jgi:hypothetical protein